MAPVLAADLVPGQFAVAVLVEAEGEVEVAQRDVPLAGDLLALDVQRQVAVARLVRLRRAAAPASAGRASSARRTRASCACSGSVCAPGGPAPRLPPRSSLIQSSTGAAAALSPAFSAASSSTRMSADSFCTAQFFCASASAVLLSPRSVQFVARLFALVHAVAALHGGGEARLQFVVGAAQRFLLRRDLLQAPARGAAAGRRCGVWSCTSAQHFARAAAGRAGSRHTRRPGSCRAASAPGRAGSAASASAGVAAPARPFRPAGSATQACMPGSASPARLQGQRRAAASLLAARPFMPATLAMQVMVTSSVGQRRQAGAAGGGRRRSRRAPSAPWRASARPANCPGSAATHRVEVLASLRESGGCFAAAWRAAGALRGGGAGAVPPRRQRGLRVAEIARIGLGCAR